MSLWILCVVDSAETNGEDNQETDDVVTAEDHLDGTTMLVSEWSANLREASLEIMRAGEERFLARREENRRLSEEMTETDDIMEAEVHLDGTSTVVRSSENYAARSLSSPELEEQRRLPAEKEDFPLYYGDRHKIVEAIDRFMEQEPAQPAVILYFNKDETKGNWISVIDGGRKQPDGRITGASSIWDRTSSHSVGRGVEKMEDDPILQMVSKRFKTRSGTRRSPAFTDPK